MKLTKLSLAAIIAVGAFSSFASATPLEEAIKGVDVSGFARLRYYYNDEAAVRGGGDDEAIRVSGLLNISAPVADDLTFGTSIATDGYNHPDIDKSGPTSPVFDKYFFQYAPAGLVLKGGKFEIPTPWTESGFGGSRGNGVLALVTSVPDWTFAAAAYLQTDGIAFAGAHNLYAIAAIGKVGPVGLQVWAANEEKIIDGTVFAEAKLAVAGFNGRVQANYLKANDDISDEDSIFAGLEAGYKNDQFFVTAAVTWTNEDLVAYSLDDDNDGFIKFGKQLYYHTNNRADVLAAGVKGGVTVDKFGGELGLGYADDGQSGEDALEVYGVLSYKYAKNFGLEVHYSWLTGDAYTAADDTTEFRFQAQYNF